jgi:hypothetical protein
MTHPRLAILLLVPLLAAACEQSEPTAVDPVALQGADPAPELSRASVELVEFGPIPLLFTFPVTCLAGNVLVSGTILLRDRILTLGDGSRHITRKLDVSNTKISLGNQVWTAGPNASEIFIMKFAPDGNIVLQEHLGAVIFRAGNARPELQLVHQIHFVNLPHGEPGEPHLDHNFFNIRCIGPES